MAGGDEGGTFDASGAFLSLKDMDESASKKTDTKLKDKGSKAKQDKSGSHSPPVSI